MKTLKVKVIKKFLDCYTGKYHKVGDILEVSEARYREILRTDKFVEIVKDEKPKVEK